MFSQQNAQFNVLIKYTVITVKTTGHIQEICIHTKVGFNYFYNYSTTTTNVTAKM